MDERIPAFQGLDQLSYDLIPAGRVALCPILNGPDQASLVVIHGVSELASPTVQSRRDDKNNPDKEAGASLKAAGAITR
jgi:hypothetical protein